MGTQWTDGKRKTVLYKFYKKRDDHPMTIMKRSAMSEGGKVAPFSSEVTRGIKTTSPRISNRRQKRF